VTTQLQLINIIIIISTSSSSYCQFYTGASRVFWYVCSACGLKCAQRRPVQYISSLYRSLCDSIIFHGSFPWKHNSVFSDATSLLRIHVYSITVIPRLTKTIRSGITFVSRNVIVTHIQTEKISSWNGPTVHVCCFMLARASTKTFVSRIHIR